MRLSAGAISPHAEFQAHLEQGQFMVQRVVGGEELVFFPRTVAPGTGEDLEWVEVSGRGTVYSTTAIRKRPPEPSLNIALIDLDEGPRMMSRVEGIDAHDVTIGMRVQSAIIPRSGEEGGFMVVFRPLSDAPGSAKE